MPVNATIFTDGAFGAKYWISQGANVNYWSDDDFDERGHGEEFTRRLYVFGLKYAATRS